MSMAMSRQRRCCCGGYGANCNHRHECPVVVIYRRGHLIKPMESGITLFSIILLLGAAHGLFLALALLNAPGGNLVAHRYLALLTLVFAIDLASEFLYQARYYTQATYLVGINDPLDFLYGPLTYFYVRALTEPEQAGLTGRRWLHFLPCGISYLVLIPFFFLNPDFKLRLLYADIEVETLQQSFAVLGYVLVILLSIIQIGVYLSLSICNLKQHARLIRDQFSYTERISLVWLRNLLTFLLAIYLVYLVDAFFSDAFGFEEEINNILYLMIVIMIYAMGYLGLRQPVIFARLKTNLNTIGPQEEMKPPRRRKYQKSALNADLSGVLSHELKEHMQSKKPYLDSALTLPQLAAQLDISPNYLSQVINEQTGANFFDFINAYRVEYAKSALTDPATAQSNILTIALDAGFNSKSTFYSAFKKHTAMTPNQFRKSQVA